MTHNKQITDAVCTVLFSLFIAVIGVLIVLFPPKSFSERENRTLSKFPELSLSVLINGDFFSGVGDFYSDQLPFRESFGYLYSITELALGRREVNGIVICNDGILVARPTDTDTDILQNNLRAIEELCMRDPSTVFFCPPDQAAVFKEYLPSALCKSRTSTPIYQASDKFFALAASDPQKYYYRTDHHWTTAGAYAAYTVICGELGITPQSECFFEYQTASDDFYGSAFRRSALPNIMVAPDQITLYRYESDTFLTVTDRITQKTWQGLYRTSALDTGDKYCVFLGGNYAHLSITDKSDLKREKMLVIKDSFANSLIPFLALHYDLEIIDPRYAELSYITELCAGEKFDKTLILCSQDTLASEKSISRALHCFHSQQSTSG